MKSKIIIISCLIIGVGIAVILNVYLGPILISRGNMVFDDNVPSSLPASVRSSKKQHLKQIPAQPSPDIGTMFTENFDTAYTVKEVWNMGESTSPGWWLSSGAYFYSANGIGSTISGSLPAIDPWRVAYFISNPLDTDDGYHPQNIFRLVLIRSKWKNFQQEAYFRITKDNLSTSPNRNASNGLLFFNRYQDAFNLYYTGIRVDGAAVIKKKINGIYYTLAYKSFYDDTTPYNRDTNPNLIPSQKWIGLKSEIKTSPDNTVSIELFIDKDKTGNWVLAAEAKDDGKTYGGSAISNEGYAGIRTDFMDVEFDDYKVMRL